jgi:predicted TIM-barrel fold metal-dependent hydrolase
MGIKLTITHPFTEGAGTILTVEQQQALVAKGAYIEHCFNACLAKGLDPRIMAGAVKTVGAEHCVLSTDLGQATNPAPAEGMRMMIAKMLECGLSEPEVELLVKTNPSRLLNLK